MSTLGVSPVDRFDVFSARRRANHWNRGRVTHEIAIHAMRIPKESPTSFFIQNVSFAHQSALLKKSTHLRSSSQIKRSGYHERHCRMAWHNHIEIWGARLGWGRCKQRHWLREGGYQAHDKNKQVNTLIIHKSMKKGKKGGGSRESRESRASPLEL